MSIWEAILWGVLQGATEFLPVSSSGHLVLVPWLLHLTTPDVTFDVMLHAGTLLASLVFFWGDICTLLKGLWESIRTRHLTASGHMALLVVVGVVPAGLAGVLWEDVVASAFGAPAVVAALLLVTGALLALGERVGRRERSLASLTWRDALWIGLAQCVALLPGVSRSGTTISAGLLRDLDREAATRYSFLLAMPLIAGATGYSLLTLPDGGEGVSLGLLAVGLITAAVAGYAALHWLLGLVRRHSVWPFAIYCWAIGTFCLIVAAVR
ncbi:MAG: undecaprenyl-diphosphatase UppP [Anaerolineales bacterium]